MILKMIKVLITEGPPSLPSGIVTPVDGMNFVTPPILKNTWNKKQTPNPRHNNLLNNFLLLVEISIKRIKLLIKTKIRQIPKITPNSSQITEKIKSDSLTGISNGRPFPSPIPNQLPVPMANKDWHT